MTNPSETSQAKDRAHNETDPWLGFDEFDGADDPLAWPEDDSGLPEPDRVAEPQIPERGDLDSDSGPDLSDDGPRVYGPRTLDLTGQRFGKLIAIRNTGIRKRTYVWLCRCDCGNLTEAQAHRLRNGDKQSCGCLYSDRQRVDLTWQRFGRLVAIRDVGQTKAGDRIWLCRCDCGNKTRVAAGNLRTGHTRSCGCLKRNKDRS